MIWIDRSVPQAVAHSLRLVRDDVCWVGDLYSQHTKDMVWLADAGSAGVLVILRDKKVRSRPGERRTIIDNRVGCFIVNQKHNPTKWEYLRLIAGSLDGMQERFAATARPFIYTVDSHGEFRLVSPAISGGG